jgi:polar amino acid transport system substrate-binding protein
MRWSRAAAGPRARQQQLELPGTTAVLASRIRPRHRSRVSRRIHVILALGLGLGVGVSRAAGSPGPGSKPGTLPDLGGRVVVIAVEDDYPPFNYIVPATGKPGGWDYDAIRELGRRLNFHPEFREIAWDSMIQGVVTGQFDMAANGITVTPERSRVVDFSSSYAQVRQRLLVRAAEGRFASLEQFAGTAGAKLGAQKGNTNYTKAEELVGRTRVVAYDGFGDLVQALINADLDAVIIDDVGGQGYVGANAGRLRLLGGALAAQDLAMVFAQGSSLRPAVDAALAAMRADGSLGRLNAAWFSPGFRAAGATGP